MQLAGGGPKFASFAKSGDKIANLATLLEIGGRTKRADGRSGRTDGRSDGGIFAFTRAGLRERVR